MNIQISPAYTYTKYVLKQLSIMVLYNPICINIIQVFLRWLSDWPWPSWSQDGGLECEDKVTTVPPCGLDVPRTQTISLSCHHHNYTMAMQPVLGLTEDSRTTDSEYRTAHSSTHKLINLSDSLIFDQTGIKQ